MKIAINAKLIKLAKLFRRHGSKLYLVGGFVRNAVLGIPCDDIDLAGSMPLKKLNEILKDTEFQYVDKNPKLFCCEIIVDGARWEYTTFRKERYAEGGKHTPIEIQQVKTPEEDAKRRDFTMNSIYLDVLKGELIDPFNGIIDTKRHIIKSILDPNIVFADDGLRILRMIRLSSELGFFIESKTQQSAELNKHLLNDISGQRKYGEIYYILTSINRYPNLTKKRAYIWGLQKFNTMQLWKYFYLPINKVKFKVVKKVEIEDRFLGLTIDIVNSVRPHDIESFLYNFLSNEGLGFSNATVNDYIKIITGYIDAIERLNNKDYFFKYFDYFLRISKILKKINRKLYKKYNFFYNYLINNKIAIQVKNLNIKGNDIKLQFPKIPHKRYSYILNELLSKVFDGKLENNKDSLLKEVENYDY